MPKKKICFIVSSPLTAKAFLFEQMLALAHHYDVTLIANFGKGQEEGFGPINIISVPVIRKISLFNDVGALFKIICIFLKQGFSVVHTVTPKAALIGLLAAYIARVPVRIHVFTGQLWVTRHGMPRFFLKCLDRLLALLATHLLVDSPSQRDFLIRENVVKANRTVVLGKGSICGVVVEKFHPAPFKRVDIRGKLSISETDLVFLYLGRLNQDKGLLVLAEAFSKLNRVDTHLVIVGPDEQNIALRISALCGACSNRLHFVPYTDVPQDYMAAADVFCLPSFREGFGNVIIEAASVGIPAIGSNIYGITDAIENGVTGLLAEPGDVHDLLTKIKTLANDGELRKQMGDNARIRAHASFSSHEITSAMIGYYEALPI